MGHLLQPLQCLQNVYCLEHYLHQRKETCGSLDAVELQFQLSLITVHVESWGLSTPKEQQVPHL